MSFLDKARRALGQAKGRAGALAGQHGDKIDHAIDKGGRYVDRRTSGKYSDKIHKGSDAAKRAATRLADQHREKEQTASGPKAPEGLASRAHGPSQPLDATPPIDATPPLDATPPIDAAGPVDRPDPLVADPLVPDPNRQDPNRP